MFMNEAEKLRDSYYDKGVFFIVYPNGGFYSFRRHKDTPKGVGKEALLALCVIADRHKQRLMLFCTHEKCRQLYESCGFKVTHHVHGGGYNRWEMERQPNVLSL